MVGLLVAQPEYHLNSQVKEENSRCSTWKISSPFAGRVGEDKTGLQSAKIKKKKSFVIPFSRERAEVDGGVRDGIFCQA